MGHFGSNPGELPVEIRAMTPADADEVHYVAQRLPEHFNEGGVKHITWAVQDRAGLVAVYGGQLAGFLIYDVSPPTVEILWMAVLPFYQQRGVGRSLIEAMADLMKSTSPAVSVIDVRTLAAHEDHAGYVGTRAFYEGVGFVLAGIDKGHFADGTDAAVYRRAI